MPETLDEKELTALIQRVFQPTAQDRALAILIDLPDSQVPDHPAWAERRAMASTWAQSLGAHNPALDMDIHQIVYRNPRMNNADLPAQAWLLPGPLPASADDLDESQSQSFAALLHSHQILLAPTEFSATAPLKLSAVEHGFRAATMPGFSAAMIPALRLDYGEINRRVQALKKLLDQAQAAELRFEVEGQADAALHLDLRHRQAHASGGLLPTPATAGNLPSGEAYIVPYEGEVEGVPSQSQGQMPVQFGEEIVVYTVAENRAVQVQGAGPAAQEQAELLQAEPAYGNLAELGLGVLADFGIQPCGSILLDEKLGLHIAFGRSDHFGGQVGATQFSRPEAVVHIDRVYIDALQPKVRVAQADLLMADGSVTNLMRNNQYVVEL